MNRINIGYPTRKGISFHRPLSLMGILGIFVLLAGCSQGAGATDSTPTPIPTPIVPEKPIYTVEQGTVVNTLEFTGRVSPVQEQGLYFKTDGFVAETFVARGDLVEEGDLIAELEIVDLQNRLAQQQVALQTAETILAKAEQEIADQLVESQINLEKLELQLEQEQAGGTSSRLTAAAVGLEQAQRELDRAQEAYDTAWQEARDWELNMREPSCLPGQGGGVPCTGQPLKDKLENEREATKRALAFAEDGLRVAQADYNDAYASRDASSISTEIIEKDIELAQHRIEMLERGVDPLLELDVQRAKLEIADTERQIADARLVAPFDGEILSVSVRAGEPAQAFRTAVILADPSALEITAELGSEELNQMSLGQPATIKLRSRPEQTFSGQVRQLPYPYGGGSSESDEEDTAVRVAFDDATIELAMGELATVAIVLEERLDALWLSPAALRSFQGRTFVVVQDGDSQRRVDVRTGIESDDKVEILAGLQEGQIVVGE